MILVGVGGDPLPESTVIREKPPITAFYTPPPWVGMGNHTKTPHRG